MRLGVMKGRLGPVIGPTIGRACGTPRAGVGRRARPLPEEGRPRSHPDRMQAVAGRVLARSP